MSNTGGDQHQNRSGTDDAGQVDAADGRTDQETGATGETIEVPAAEPAEFTKPAAAPGPVGPGDTAVIPAGALSAATASRADTGADGSEGPGRATAVPEPTGGPDAEAPAAPAPAAAPAADTAEDRHDTNAPGTGAEPVQPADADATERHQAGLPVADDAGAPVELEQADRGEDDARARLDAAVQRANAVPVASDTDRDLDRDADAATAPAPVPADQVRRETYVPPAAGAAVAGAAMLAPDAPATAGPHTVYVPAPTPPKRKSNRGFGVLVALIGTVAFAALYAGVAYLLFLGQYGDATTASEQFLRFLPLYIFWVPVIAMFVGFALLAIIVNRGAWWMYAVFGLLVGVLVYFSYIGAALLTVEAWRFTPQQAVDFLNTRWLDPLAIAAAVIAREIPIWFGGWIAKRGRAVAERNRLALQAYDREVAAGPRPDAS